MSTGIPYGGAAQRWHENPLQEEVDRLRVQFRTLREAVLEYTELHEHGGSHLEYLAAYSRLRELVGLPQED